MTTFKTVDGGVFEWVPDSDQTFLEELRNHNSIIGRVRNDVVARRQLGEYTHYNVFPQHIVWYRD